jgi:glucokinase
MATLAVDFGGTRIKLGVVENGVLLSKATLEARSGDGLRPQLGRVAEALKEIAPKTVEGLGIAFPSLIDYERGKIVFDPGKYSDAQEVDLGEWAMREFGVPVAIENDARMATIGEWQFGAGRGCNDLVMVTLGTGIGTGVVQQGQVLRGAHGQSGILGGHTIVQIGGRRCPCGAHGCAEAEASTAALPTLAAEDPEFEESRLRDAFPLDYAATFKAASVGDAVALRLLHRSFDVWGALAVSLIHAFDPELVIFGGGVLASGDLVLAPIRGRVEQDAWMPSGKVRIVQSELGDAAALLACEWLVRSRNAVQIV